MCSHFGLNANVRGPSGGGDEKAPVLAGAGVGGMGAGLGCAAGGGAVVLPGAWRPFLARCRALRNSLSL